ncbi:hypothetical protein EX30DRAFT_80971 [Ascodesmis nigricans]|uniref:Uncharacterized protein n=1 Tax=Ascodesmis nigricans TaxID=341454 RepID=A0A4S2MT59_9PEZI|nr:hypothetical protein EX30DRAFT_80971 [Ascodesmis nigricans]
MQARDVRTFHLVSRFVVKMILRVCRFAYTILLYATNRAPLVLLTCVPLLIARSTLFGPESGEFPAEGDTSVASLVHHNINTCRRTMVQMRGFGNADCSRQTT